MSVSVLIGLLLALATAFASVLGFLYKHRGAISSPIVEWRRPLRTSLALFRNRWYTLGIVIATLGWGFHVGALALAPISLVQSVIAGGLVLLTVTAERIFAHVVSRREWIGVGLAAAGLVLLTLTLGTGAEQAHSDYEPATLVIYIGAVTALAAGAAGAARRGPVEEGVLLGVSAGAFWAGSDTAIKALTGNLGEGVAAVLVHPLAAVIALWSLAGLVISARSLQTGKAVPVIALTSVAANALTIAAGPAVFGDPLPDDPVGFAIRILAFALVISAAALTPAPVRAAEELETEAPA